MGAAGMNDELWVSFFSVIFYGFVASFSADQYIKYYRFGNGSKISNCRRLFFGVLSVSALLDLPVWFLCIGYMGPSTCVMETVFFKVFQCFHMLALCGYAFCLGITTILWSDILTENEDKPIIDFKNPDIGRKLFYSFFLLYFLNEFTVILSICLWMDEKDPNKFLESNEVYQFSDFTEPFLICVLAGGCLFTGVRLQRYVLSVRLGTRLQREFLVQLNGVLFLVTACYLARAILIFTLFYDFGSDDLSGISFAVWTLCTRWMPNVGSSLCLFVFMCRSQSTDNKYSSDANVLPMSENATSWAEPLIKPADARSASSGQEDGTAGEFSDDDIRPTMPIAASHRISITEDNVSSPNPMFRYENASRSFSELDDNSLPANLRFPDIFSDMDHQRNR
jgi:hypothetical protein